MVLVVRFVLKRVLTLVVWTELTAGLERVTALGVCAMYERDRLLADGASRNVRSLADAREMMLTTRKAFIAILLDRGFGEMMMKI